MNEETYEALKRLLPALTVNNMSDQGMKDLIKVKDWIDEVAKEYEE